MANCKGDEVLGLSSGAITSISSGVSCLKISSSISSISDGNEDFYSFKNSASTLTTVDFSSATGIKTIGSYAFYRCSNLLSIDLSKCTKLSSIGISAFENCTSLSKFVFPESSSLQTIPGACFVYATSLKSIKIPSTVKVLDSIGNERGAFVNSGIETLIFDDNSQLTSIGGKTFTNSNLRNITLPKTLTSITGYSFRVCLQLEKVNVKSGGVYQSLDGLLLKGSGLVYFPNLARNTDTAVVPDGITIIYSYAFIGLDAYKYVKFPSTVTQFSSDAFYGFSSLVELTVPSTIKSIGSRFVFYTESLKVDYYSDVEIVSSHFNKCSSLREINIYSNLKKIGENAFINCVNLKSVLFPSSLTSIGNNAFCYTSLETVALTNTNITELAQGVFSNNTYLKNVFLPASLKKVASNTFSGTKSVSVFYCGENGITNDAGLDSFCAKVFAV